MVCPSEGCFAGLTPDELKTVKSMRVGNYTITPAIEELLNRLRKPNQHIICVSTLQRLCDIAGVKLDDLRDNKSQYDPSLSFRALARYAVKWDQVKLDDPEFVRAVGLTYRAFAFRKQRGKRQLVPLCVDGSIRQHLKMDKSSGLPFILSKEEAFSRDLAIAQQLVADESEPLPCIAYHRIQHGVAGPKQRLVWGFAASSTIIEATLARPLIELFLNLRTPMVIGLWRMELAARMIGIKAKKWQYGLDYSGFDSSVSPLLIGVAFNILRTWFVPSEEVARRFAWCERHFVNTKILMPDGELYAKRRGIPSGSYFTQLIGSIVNYLSLQYGVLKLTGKAIGRDDVMVLGDDSVMGFGHKLDLVRFQKVMSEIGMVINPEKTHQARKGQPVQFLGHTWVRGIVDRPLIDVAKRLVYPERSDRSESSVQEKIRQRLLAYYADSRTMQELLVKSKLLQSQEADAWFGVSYAGLQETGWRKYMSALMRENLPQGDFATLGILK